MRWFQDTVNKLTIVEGNVVGNRLPEFQIELTGLVTVTAADFIL